MHFTVAFEAWESADLSFGLVFTPCPCWMLGSEKLVNLNPENPHYQAGSVRKLIDKTNILQDVANTNDKRVNVAVHRSGHGTENDLEALTEDLEREGFRVAVTRF